MSNKTGGYAFPKSHGTYYPCDLGMTMRQYIAIEAMKTFLMKDPIVDECDTSTEWLQKTAFAAYEMADIMLEVGAK